ncbi:MAG: hypothetical protein LUQ37_10115 [Methanoregulaceae archaeon]|jgi:hypothetical protein|nr:hypothetical protein [Methanoregulaceae archaeon]
MIQEAEDQHFEEAWITILRRISWNISRQSQGPAGSIQGYSRSVPNRSPRTSPPLPHLAGVYPSSGLATAVVGGLIDRSLPVQVERFETTPPYAQVIGDRYGTLVHDYTGLVWVVRTYYGSNRCEDHQWPVAKE